MVTAVMLCLSTASHAAHHPTMTHPFHSTSMLPSSLHSLMLSMFLFPLVGSQHRHGGALTFDCRKQAGRFRFFHLIDFGLNGIEVGLLIIQQRVQFEFGDFGIGLQSSLRSVVVKLQSFDLADLLLSQSDFFGMFQQMYQVVPTMVVLFILIVSTMPHLPMAFVGIVREHGYR